ncbi:MAG: PspC domain-containing protein [Deltaproteobacteria bacterium]|jgi:phage shock protein PspC (stress-responsive transcriptional regulator)|nr:PspC domain-containing protein [Deltaproteobacteria bacterium]
MNFNSKNVRGPFRSRRGLFLGVLAGLSWHLGVPRWILRLAVVALSILVAFWPVVLAYALVALLMPLEPSPLFRPW